MSPEAFFLPADGAAGGQRFCLFHAPQGDQVRGAIVYVHPFAEEMNKSRRMAALQSRALAEAGYAVLQIDLHGCGDSSGDFADATWQAWVDDVLCARRWLKTRASAPLWLWGLRAGCLVAADVAGQLSEPTQLLLWQPATSGKLVLQQFLRLRLAADMLGGQAKGAMQALHAQLAAGHAVEVAGYALSPELASGLERATLRPCERVQRVEWIELSARADAELLPASANSLARWQAAGCTVNRQIINGPSFWQTSEIEEAPKLLIATMAALDETVAA
jgi:exosortase A-associated hydrolase 2